MRKAGQQIALWREVEGNRIVTFSFLTSLTDAFCQFHFTSVQDLWLGFFFFRHTRFLLFHGAVEPSMKGSVGSGNLIFTVILVSKLNFLHRVVAENGAQIMRFWKVFAGFVNFDFCESLFKSARKSKFLSCQVGGGGVFLIFIYISQTMIRVTVGLELSSITPPLRAYIHCAVWFKQT